MFRHCPVLDHSGGVVFLESQGDFGPWPFVRNFTDFRKRGLHRIVQESRGESGMNSQKGGLQVVTHHASTTNVLNESASKPAAITFSPTLMRTGSSWQRSFCIKITTVSSGFANASKLS